MAAMMVRHLRLNLLGIKVGDMVPVDAPVLSSGLFCSAVEMVVEKVSEARVYSAALKKFIPLQVQSLMVLGKRSRRRVRLLERSRRKRHRTGRKLE